MNLNTELEGLHQRIRAFRKKYYWEQTFRGLLFFLIGFIILFTSYTSLAYKIESVALRFTLLVTNVLINLGLFTGWVLKPLIMGLFSSKFMSSDAASEYIGNRIPEVKDQLLNTLQLQRQWQHNPNNTLLYQGLMQKTHNFSNTNFTNAVNFNKVNRFVKIGIGFYTVFILTAWLWPEVYVTGAKKIIYYDKSFPKSLPFHIQFISSDLVCKQNEDFYLQIKTIGKVLPSELIIETNGVVHQMKKENSNTFSFLFTNLQTTLRFQFHFTDCSSQIYTLRVIPKPLFNTFKIEITPPAYTRLQTQSFDFVNTLLVPEGSVVNFKLDCKNQSHCTVRSSSGVQFLKPGSASDYFYSHRLMEPQSLCFSIQNQSNPPIYDSLAISLQAIKDQAPGLEMEVVKDTLHSGWLYFNGTYLDDYGFSALKFNTNLQVPGMAPVIHSSLLEFNKNKGSHVFYHYMDVRSLNLPPGSKIQYYFSVSDNDAVHGPKTTRSQTFEYQLPGLNEQLEQQNLQNSQMDQALRQSLQQSQKIQRQMEQIKKEMSEKNEFDANDQKRMQSVLEQYNQLQQSLETIQKKQAQTIENQTPETDSQLLERQKEIEKLLQQILTPELKKLIEEIKELMKQQNREAVSEKMEAFKFQQEDLQKELDLQRDQLKELHLDQQYESVLNQIKQEESEFRNLSNQTKSSPTESLQSLQNKQSELQDRVQKTLEQLGQLKKDNQALPQPMDFPNTQTFEQNVKQSMQQTQSELTKGNTSGASQSQKQTAEDLSDLQKTMEEAAAESQEAEQSVNIQQLREIIDAVLQASFRQEDLMLQIKKLNISQPQIREISRQQNQMKMDIKTASDSLYALSKKAPQISPKLRKSLSGIQHTIQQSVQNLVNGEFPKSALNMQTTMTELNNIALLLQEGLEAMQQQQRQQMNSKNSKSGTCKKPGKSKGQNPGSKGQLGQARQLQEQLNQQMKQLREQMGKQEGGTKGSSQQMKPSSKSGKGSGGVGTAEQFARMAAQQEAIRLQLLEALQRMKQQGMKAGKDLAEMMENTERELVNKQISPELIQRQQDILTRLLEQEQAEREQDEDFKRESQYKNLDQSRNLKPFLEYKRKKQAEWEPLIETPIHLTPYYRLRLQSILSNE